MDKKCSGRSSLKINIDIDSPDNILEAFIIKNIHNLSRNKHIYIRDILIKEDYLKNDIKNLKIKLTDHYYLKKFLKEFIYDLYKKGYNRKQISDLFINKYEDINLDYKIIPDNFETNLLNSKKYKDNTNINFEDIYNFDYKFTQSYNYIYSKYKIKNIFEDILINYKDKTRKKIYAKLEVTFIRNNIKHAKLIFLIMNNDMETNIKKNRIIINTLVIAHIMLLHLFQKYYFMDFTFNIKEMKTLLCSIANLKKRK